MPLVVTCFSCLPAGGVPFVTTGSRAGENPEIWQVVQTGVVQVVAPYLHDRRAIRVARALGHYMVPPGFA